ncbi:lipoprotein [Planotetraspora mira]|uniref:Lipoprotein n=1 Tax=Planotetraspora mira TaxID=58121 RepID=A0A8J3TXH1_9ACTN|nr:lipoprotein [Planotetraspora mira]
MPIKRSCILSLGVAGGALALLTGCGAGELASGAQSAADVAGVVASPSPSAAFNDADVMFTQMMIVHHQQAGDMADLAATRASDPEVEKLAAAIKDEQQAQMKDMRGMLTAWGRAAAPGQMAEGMPGLVSQSDMDKLAAAKGPRFDRLFLQHMIAHHKGAIEMARTELAQGADEQAKKLADSIVADQRSQIDQMQSILKRL